VTKVKGQPNFIYMSRIFYMSRIYHYQPDGELALGFTSGEAVIGYALTHAQVQPGAQALARWEDDGGR
jgi:hypothetical protein